VSIDPQTLHRAELVVRTMLGQDPTPRAIAHALAAANLLAPDDIRAIQASALQAHIDALDAARIGLRFHACWQSARARAARYLGDARMWSRATTQAEEQFRLAVEDADQLRAALAEQQSVVAGLEAALGLAEGEELMIWRAEHWHEIAPLGHYLTKAAAEAHCARDAGREPDLDGQPLRWIQDGPDPSEDDPTFLYAVGIEGGEADTGYAVRPVTVAAAFDPEAAE
jgi:hypothetical protein